MTSAGDWLRREMPNRHSANYRDPTANKAIGHLSRDRYWIEKSRRVRRLAQMLERARMRTDGGTANA